MSISLSSRSSSRLSSKAFWEAGLNLPSIPPSRPAPPSSDSTDSASVPSSWVYPSSWLDKSLYSFSKSSKASLKDSSVIPSSLGVQSEYDSEPSSLESLLSELLFEKGFVASSSSSSGSFLSTQSFN